MLLDRCRREGYVYRYGGDEFIAFFPIEREEQAQEFKKDVVAELEENDIRVSIGVIVTDPASGKSFDYYMRAADEEMYRVKAARKQPKNKN